MPSNCAGNFPASVSRSCRPTSGSQILNFRRAGADRPPGRGGEDVYGLSPENFVFTPLKSEPNSCEHNGHRRCPEPAVAENPELQLEGERTREEEYVGFRMPAKNGQSRLARCVKKQYRGQSAGSGRSRDDLLPQSRQWRVVSIVMQGRRQYPDRTR